MVGELRPVTTLSPQHYARDPCAHPPLIAYDDFLWFDVGELKFPDSFELVVCDGPAIRSQVESHKSAWRVGLLPVLRDRGVRLGEILMDDVEDPRIRSLVARWEGQHNFSMQITQTATGGYLTARAAGLGGDRRGRSPWPRD